MMWGCITYDGDNWHFRPRWINHDIYGSIGAITTFQIWKYIFLVIAHRLVPFSFSNSDYLLQISALENRRYAIFLGTLYINDFFTDFNKTLNICVTIWSNNRCYSFAKISVFDEEKYVKNSNKKIEMSEILAEILHKYFNQLELMVCKFLLKTIEQKQFYVTLKFIACLHFFYDCGANI